MANNKSVDNSKHGRWTSGWKARGPRRKLSAPKKALFALLTTVAVLLVLEIVLAAAGVQPGVYQEDPYVGFSSYIPLLVEEQGADGQTYMATSPNKRPWFNAQRFLKKKPRGEYRIFCLGGSTTYGHPYDDTTSFAGWLRQLLPAADDSRRWEVINAGGISYASYRVAMVMEELARYDPDLFVIYSGHNEYLEHRTYASLVELPSEVRNLGALLGRSRTYTAVKQLVGGAETRGTNTKPSGERLPSEVETLLDHAVGPEAYTRDERFQQQVLSHYRFNLRRMVDLARTAGAQVILVTPASNLRDCSPFKSEHRAGLSYEDAQRWQSLFGRAAEAEKAGRFDEALAALDEAASIDDRYAQLHFVRGRLLLALGRWPEAKAALVRARDEDICPLRALSPMLKIVADVAAEKNVRLIDFAAFVEQASEHEIPGEKLFLDHVHPTIEGNRALALLLIEHMIRQQVVRPGRSWGEPAIAEVTQRVSSKVDQSAQGVALRNLAKVLSWAGKAEEADRLALRAVQMIPHDAEAQYEAGNACFRRGDVDRAIAYYKQALALDPDSAATHYGLGLANAQTGQMPAAVGHYEKALQLDPGFAAAHYNLGIILESRGDLARATRHYREAIRHNPRDASAYNNLGVVLAKQGELADAKAHFEQALRVNPASADAHANLGQVFAELGDVATAIGHYREALRHQPGHVAASHHLDTALKRMRDQGAP